jgi:hypothetical protein
MKRSRINPVSKKKLAIRKEYASMAAAFILKYSKCVVYPNRNATDVHHTRGRLGAMLVDKKWWLPVSRAGHIWIHANPREATEKGLLFSRFGLVDDIDGLLVERFYK